MQSNQSCILHILFLTWIPQRAPQGKPFGEFHFSSLVWRCPRWLRLLLWNDIFHLCQWHILNVRCTCCQEKYEAVSLTVFRLAWRKSKDQTGLFWRSLWPILSEHEVMINVYLIVFITIVTFYFGLLSASAFSKTKLIYMCWVLGGLLGGLFYFWRRAESNMNPKNFKEKEWNWLMMERNVLKGHSLMRGQNFAIMIAKIKR